MQKKGEVRSSIQVEDVKGTVDVEELQGLLERQCEAKVMHVDASS
jgi:hypothetical protein